MNFKQTMAFFRKGDYWMNPVDESDLPKLAEHRNTFETWRNLTSSLPVQPYRQKEWLDGLKNSMYFVAYHHNEPQQQEERVGLLRLTDIDWQNSTGAVGVDIFQGFRGKGYAKPVLDLLVDYCFNSINLHRVWLMVLDDNEPAKKVYQGLGFQEEGAMRKHIYRDGFYHDYIIMGMLKDEFKA